MAILTADDYIAAARQLYDITKTAEITTVANNEFSTLDVAGMPGAGSLAVGNTANGLVPDDTVAGYPLITAFGGGATGHLTRVNFACTVACRMRLWDRLFNVGSVSLTSLATTTLASQPSYTGRLPGGTDYGNLFILIEINAAVSATATTVTVTYKNQAGTTGRSTGATASLSGFTTRRIIVMPLQAGDTGVQKIETVVVGGTVATTGSVNVIVARLLVESMRVPIANAADAYGFDRVGFPQVWDTSALWLTVIPDSTSSGIPSVQFEIANK